jgi:hypothetical protein
MKIQKTGIIVGIAQSHDPMKVRVQVRPEQEASEQRVKPYPQSEQERTAAQMSESIAKQIRSAIPGAAIMGPGHSPFGNQQVEEWLVPADRTSGLTVGKKVTLTLETLDEET